MATFDHIDRCISVGDADIAAALASRADAKALLGRMAEVARPNEGAPKILLVLARMAKTGCDWLDGDLRVELVGDGEVSVVEVLTELGGGLRERALPSFSLSVPLEEFVRSVTRVPQMIAPLTVKSTSERRLVLVSGEDRALRSMPPLPVTIADEHLIELPSSMSEEPPVKAKDPGPPPPPQAGKAKAAVVAPPPPAAKITPKRPVRPALAPAPAPKPPSPRPTPPRPPPVADAAKPDAAKPKLAGPSPLRAPLAPPRPTKRRES